LTREILLSVRFLFFKEPMFTTAVAAAHGWLSGLKLDVKKTASFCLADFQRTVPSNQTVARDIRLL
jgi:hypothetical protein